MKTWHARIVCGLNDYGTWIPTGCTDRQAAEDYIELYRPRGAVFEWALL